MRDRVFRVISVKVGPGEPERGRGRTNLQVRVCTGPAARTCLVCRCMWMRAGAHARALSLVARAGERHSWPTRLARPRAGSEAAVAAAATPGCAVSGISEQAQSRKQYNFRSVVIGKRRAARPAIADDKTNLRYHTFVDTEARAGVKAIGLRS